MYKTVFPDNAMRKYYVQNRFPGQDSNIIALSQVSYKHVPSVILQAT